MSFNPILPSTDYSTLTAEQIIAQKKKIAEETRKLDEILKSKMEEQRAGFVQNVAEQITALDMQPAEFIDGLKSIFKMPTDSFYSAVEVFDSIPDDKLEQWFADFNGMKNRHFAKSKTPIFNKIPKMTRAGVSPDKFSIVYFEDIKGGPKGLQKLAEKIAPTREEAIKLLAEGFNLEDPKDKAAIALNILYPAKPEPVKEEPKATDKPAAKKAAKV